MHVRTLDDVIQPYRHLPGAIQTALIRVETHPTFRGLTRGSLKVLKALVTRASATNGAAMIRARMDRVADEAGVSTKTAQRAMRTFFNVGWVLPASEGRSEYGVFESRRYTFSAALCELVHLPTKGKPAAIFRQETQMSGGAIKTDLSLQKDQQEISIKNRNGEPPTLPVAVNAIPEETGINPTGVCKLLGIARQVGYQLEHVYAVAKPYLVKIGASSPGRAYRYLLTMLNNPRKADYAGKAAQMLRAAVPDQAKTLADVARQCRFKRFVHVSNGMQVRFFDGTAEVRRDAESVLYAGEQMQGLYRGVASGNLREVLE